MTVRIHGNSPTMIHPQETAGNQVGFIHRERVLAADIPSLEVSSIISSDRQNSWSSKDIIIRLARPGRVSVKLLLSVAGESLASSEMSFSATEDNSTHVIEINNYWDNVRITGVSGTQDIIGILVSS